MSDDPLWLVKDDPDGKWFCDCEAGIVDAPYHDLETYPTGGTGWLWSCAECHRAFKFAKAVTLRVSLYELAEQLTEVDPNYWTTGERFLDRAECSL